MHVLFTPLSGSSIAHIVRSLALADVLKARGHEVLFTASTKRRRFIEQAGFPVFGIGHSEINLNDEDDQGLSYFQHHRAEFLEWFEDELAAATAFRPDAIVSSPNFFGAIAAKKLGIPHVSVINGNWHPEFRGVLGLGKSKQSLAHQLCRRMLNPVLARGFDRLYMTEIQGWYRDLGFSELPQGRKELHKGLPALIPGIPSLEPLTREVPFTRYIGPLQWQGFEREPFHMPFANSDKPLVYVTLGGSAFTAKTYCSLISTFAKREDWNTLLSLGPNVKREALPEDLPHLAVRQYVPGLQVCEQASVVVCAANHGTITQALTFGKPVVSIPRNIDQATFAARLTELHAGINLNTVGLKGFTKREAYLAGANTVSSQAILDGVEQALTSSNLKAGARRLQREIVAYPNSEQAGADLIEQTARGEAW